MLSHMTWRMSILPEEAAAGNPPARKKKKSCQLDFNSFLARNI
jgi:hypothetical protein